MKKRLSYSEKSFAYSQKNSVYSQKRLSYLFLILILILGAIFRLSGILSGISAFTYDQGRDMLVVYDLVVNYKLTLIGPTTGLAGVFYGPWWYWLLSLPFFIFAGDPRAMVGLVAFLGVICIALAFFIGEKIGGKFWAVWAAVMVAISPSFVETSSQVWNPNLVPFLVFLSLWLLLKISQREKKVYFFLLGLIISFIFQFQAAFGLFNFLGVLIFLTIWFRGKIFIFLLGFLPVFLPQIIFDLRHNFLITKAVIQAVIHPQIYQQALSLGERILERMRLFLTISAKTLTLENKFLATLVVIFGLLSFYLFLKKAPQRLKPPAYFWLIIILTLFLGFSLYQDMVWDYYLVGLPALIIFFLLLSFSQSRGFLKVLNLILAVFLIVWNLQLHLLPRPGWAGDASVLKNQLEVIDFIYQDAQNKKFNYIVYTPPLLDYNYHYLFLWYGQKKYGYLPSESQEPQKLFYLVLEPDVYMPARQTLWLKAREGDGQPIFRQKFATGLEVEKRRR